MRCNILFFGSFGWDEQILTTLLLRKGFQAHFVKIDAVEHIEESLENERFDLFILSAPADTLLEQAKKQNSYAIAYHLSYLYLLSDEESDRYDELKNFAVNNIITGTQSEHNLASFISLVLKKERYKVELSRMGNYMKDATIILERNEEANYVVVDANKAFLSLESIKLNQIMGKTLDNLKLDFKVKMLEEEIEEVFQSQEPKHLPSYFFVQEGKREWFELYIYRATMNQVAIIASPLSEIKRTNDKAEAAKRYLQTILNAQKHMIYITDGERLINTNDAFLSFTGFKTMYDFIKAHQLPRNIYEKSEGDAYIDTQNPKWLNTVAENPKDIYKIRIKKEDTVYIFIPSVEKVRINDMMQYVVILTDISELESEKENLRVIAMTDQLTGACNRFKFNAVIEEKFATSKRYKTPLSVIMFDVDDFKSINDRYSHEVGDAILKRLAHIVKAEIRQSDLFIRWGGDEFVIILSNTTKASTGIVAEKIRKRFEDFTFENVSSVTCSFGVATLEAEDSVSKFIAKADEAMYQAKLAGRNCTRTI